MAFRRLEKKLTFIDVYAISTGAMFSSGFFLLPGLAFAQAGSSVILAYLCAGLLIVPAMLSKAELATAMPRAGGTYFFLDRALGPMAGTVGGLGTWMAMVLKTAFAFVGVGAYLALFYDLPIDGVAVGLTAAFAVVNLFGAKETAGIQRFLVSSLVAILVVFVVAGFIEIFKLGEGPGGTPAQVLGSFGDTDAASFLSTIGMVFVSYAGLTKVASVAEEVRAPHKNILRGMVYSLLTATAIYVLGVFIMVVVIDPVALSGSLTPVATAADAVLGWMPGETTAVWVVTIAALAAFLSTGNAGIMSASRYLLAMGRDSLVPSQFANVGRFGTPALGVIVTSIVIAACVTLLDVASLAKLASAFQLLMFAMINLAVIVMRESRIEAYDPSYRSPLYPWLHIAGTLIPLVLIGELGHLAIVFTAGVVAVCLGWYVWYARHRVRRTGAVFHWFARMGQKRYNGLDDELRDILREQGPRPKDSLEEVMSMARTVDVADDVEVREVFDLAAGILATSVPKPEEELATELYEGIRSGQIPAGGGIALPHMRVAGLEHPSLVVVRSQAGIKVTVSDEHGTNEQRIHRFFFLISPEEDPARHLRLLAGIAQWATSDNNGTSTE